MKILLKILLGKNSNVLLTHMDVNWPFSVNYLNLTIVKNDYSF